MPIKLSIEYPTMFTITPQEFSSYAKNDEKAWKELKGCQIIEKDQVIGIIAAVNPGKKRFINYTTRDCGDASKNQICFFEFDNKKWLIGVNHQLKLKIIRIRIVNGAGESARKKSKKRTS